jgi:hypothetical protein
MNANLGAAERKHMGRAPKAIAAVSAITFLGVVSVGAVLEGSADAAFHGAHAALAKNFSVVETTTSYRFPPGLPVGGVAVIDTHGVKGGRETNRTLLTCIVMNRHTGECFATTITNRGQVDSQGPLDLAAPFGQLAITGGTGLYTAARGYIVRTKITQTKVRESFHFIR